nr:Dna2/Cas4 domain-containing protein [Candidatus Woesearchaeota archaeon]
MAFELFLAGFVAFLAFLVTWLLRKLGVSKELYKNKSVYSDIERPEKAMFSKKHLLAGKPDSILHTKSGLVPVEVKSGSRPKQPYYSHIMQLASYCLLIEINREKPKHGLIQYADGEPFMIPYTDELRDRVIETIGEMRGHIYRKELDGEGCGREGCLVCNLNCAK